MSQYGRRQRCGVSCSIYLTQRSRIGVSHNINRASALTTVRHMHATCITQVSYIWGLCWGFWLLAYFRPWRLQGTYIFSKLSNF